MVSHFRASGRGGALSSSEVDRRGALRRPSAHCNPSPHVLSHVVRIFGKVAHRHEKPSLQAFWRSSGNRPPSVPRPGDRASKVHRDFRVYTSCCFHHIGARNRAIAMAVLQLIGVFCSPPFNRTRRRFLRAGCAFDDLTDFVVRYVPAIQDYIRQGRNGPIKWRTKYPFGSKCQSNH